MAWQLELHNVGQASRLSAGWDVRYFGSAGARHSCAPPRQARRLSYVGYGLFAPNRHTILSAATEKFVSAIAQNPLELLLLLRVH